SLIKYCAAGNIIREEYITSPDSSEEEYEDSIEVQIAQKGTSFQTEKGKQPPKEMKASIQSNQMEMDKEEARPSPEGESLRQKRHIWRMLELPPIPQGLHPQTLM
ncbi:hypothetical protein O181_110307, partial [Austropuccinia psidii MF-1]|nr:hypothetical protein [Austropuccinia psidii MF-1]